MPSENANQLKWKDLDGEQKYEVVELVRRQEVSVTELCATFGVSRQTLYRAVETADRASMKALAPKPKGRPPVPATQKEIQALRKRNKELEQDLKKQKLKNEVAKALLELHRKVERGQKLPGEKKTGGQPELPDTAGFGQAGQHEGVAGGDDS